MLIESQLNTNDEQFKRNTAHNKKLADELRGRLSLVGQGGGEKYLRRHHEQGKLFVRERIDKLLDQGSPFLELNPLAA
ncbi:MAG: methylcrotonoyl-CoA carboxylase, partial [Chloroflexi bacterium]|nr:methylcrotonoyl-CoA carboxylase [Chloroflexota bacterium]